MRRQVFVRFFGVHGAARNVSRGDGYGYGYGYGYGDAPRERHARSVA